jgi:hypothetical protein
MERFILAGSTVWLEEMRPTSKGPPHNLNITCIRYTQRRPKHHVHVSRYNQYFYMKRTALPEERTTR